MPAAVRCIALAVAAALAAVALIEFTAEPAAASPVSRPLRSSALRSSDPSTAPVTYVPPVDAAVDDPFRAPASPYGPGHRGIEYDTAPGTVIDASAPGDVVFAGSVAGSRWVTIRHDDGIRTTYGPLATVDVALGDTVEQADRLGTSAGKLLFTARVGDNYIDPASLLSAADQVHLVPEPLSLPSFPPSSFGASDLLSPDAVASALAWGSDRVVQQAESLYEVTPVPIIIDTVHALADWRAQQGHCTNDGVTVAAPAGRRFAILVGGLGSSSDHASIDDVDTAALGYDSDDVVRFSYNGGRVPTSHGLSPELAGLTTTSYRPSDTSADLEVAGRRLAELLAGAVARAPVSTMVDVYAHSQGGLVTRLALDDLAASDRSVLHRLGVVVTLATPNVGAELAGLLQAITVAPVASSTVDALGALEGTELRSGDPSLAQLAPGSDLLRELNAQPLPPGPSYVSIAAEGDAVVPSPDAHLDGADNVIVPVVGLNAHSELPGSAAATREMALALAGLPPTCESATDAIGDALWGDLLHNGEHFVAATRGP